jgi:hypothetical protein
MVAVLLAQEAIRVTPPERLTAMFRELLADPLRAQIGMRARSVFDEHAGASERCFAAIMKILAGNPPSSTAAGPS